MLSVTSFVDSHHVSMTTDKSLWESNTRHWSSTCANLFIDLIWCWMCHTKMSYSTQCYWYESQNAQGTESSWTGLLCGLSGSIRVWAAAPHGLEVMMWLAHPNQSDQSFIGCCVWSNLAKQVTKRLPRNTGSWFTTSPRQTHHCINTHIHSISKSNTEHRALCWKGNRDILIKAHTSTSAIELHAQ